MTYRSPLRVVFGTCHRVTAVALGAMLLCTSCFIPFSDRTKFNVEPSAMHLVDAGTQVDVSEALILVINSYSRLAEPWRLNDAFVFRPSESFPMYRDCTVYLSGPCPQPISETGTEAFIIVAPGYAPKYFTPLRGTEQGEEVHWRLRGVSSDQSQKVFEDLRTLVNDKLIAIDTLKSWGDMQTETLGEVPWDISMDTSRSVRVSLTSDEKNLIDSFIVSSLAKLK